MNIIKSENKTLEDVNLGLIGRLQQQEMKVSDLMGTIQMKDSQLDRNKDALNKAEQVIKRLTTEISNARRQNDFNERQLTMLQEQYRNLQNSYNLQEKDI